MTYFPFSLVAEFSDVSCAVKDIATKILEVHNNRSSTATLETLRTCHAYRMIASLLFPTCMLRFLCLSFAPRLPHRSSTSFSSGTTATATTSILSLSANMTTTPQEDWQPLDPESLVSAPCLIEQTLCQPSDTRAQLAKDVDYAKAVLEAWKEEEDINWQAYWKPVTYHDAASGSDLYGYCIRRKEQEPESDATSETKVPAIVFFHTGAGPHDMFLLYKAVSLVNSVDEKDCVVFVADILGDESGWAWNPDRSRYNTARKQVLGVVENDKQESNKNSGPYRPVLQGRIQAAMDYLVRNESVDRFAAFGWCLGGHPVLELSRMSSSARPLLKALATFHGVFDGLKAPAEADSGGANDFPLVDVLICHGTADPFVPSENVERALATLQAHRFRTSLLQLSAKHGFTNPAQHFNDNPAFAFDSEAAAKAWRQAVNLVREKLW